MNSTESPSRIDISGLEVTALAREISSRLSGSYLSNIYSAGESQLLTFGRREEEKMVVISPRLGSWLTKRSGQRSVTTPFTTSLRRELLRSKLDSVSQLDMDRVFVYAFSSRESKRELVLELMPPGNIILLDERRQTIVSLREVRTPQRRIVRGAPYAPPLQSRLSPEQLDETRLKSILAKESKVGKALGRGISLPRRYVDEILRRSALKQDDPSPRGELKVKEIADVVKDVMDEAAHPHPYVVKQDGAVQVMSIKPTTGEILREASSFSELLDEMLGPSLGAIEREAETPGERKEKEYRVTLSKLDAQLAALEESSRKLRERASRVRGGMTREEAIEEFRAVKELAPRETIRKIEKENSPASIASLLFDLAKQKESEANKVRDASVGLRKRMGRESKLGKERNVRAVSEPRKKEWYEKFRWFFTSQDRLALGGRDAHSNSILVKRHLETGDVVYHADLFGSPFFILKGGKAQTGEEMKELAKSTVAFSSGWKTGLGSADAYWVNNDQLTATAPSGEYLAKGSFMVRGKKNFVNKNILQISVGVDGEGRLVSGPEEAIAKHAIAYLTLIPSREKTSETAKKVLIELKRAVGEKVKFDDTVDDVLRMLPSGGGKIVRRRTRATSG